MDAPCDLHALIQAHLDAYNRHDAAAIIELYDPAVQSFEHPGKLSAANRDELRAQFDNTFRNIPAISVKVLHRTVLERSVIDDQETSVPGLGVVRTAVVYSIEGCRIGRVDIFQ